MLAQPLWARYTACVVLDLLGGKTVQRVLAVDGGGIRGIIPTLVLQEIERRTKRPIASMFDVMAGTSTGALIALGLSVPSDDGTTPKYGTADILAIYKDRRKELFDRPFLHALTSLWGLAGPKYPSENLDNLVLDVLGDARLADALTDAVVATYDLENRAPFVFRAREARADKGLNFLTRSVARAAIAAPSYFEPAKLPDAGTGAIRWLVDGGIFANDPSLYGLAEAQLRAPREGNDADGGVLLLSLGTGEVKTPIPGPKAAGWGALSWLSPILEITSSGAADELTNDLRILLESHTSHILRLQPRLTNAESAMDDISDGHIAALEKAASDLITANDAEIDALCRQLTAAGEAA